eukprot:TRINITY_DN31_c1_g1_i5.p1 TRINITY_DN31_c1_g1~~TRINITY_DN31_c1_g1_i5.p1  ORF type:complete len:5333 (+),score=1101.56 TRINITY_DN31_c1_g1_i5:1885-15999(+)
MDAGIKISVDPIDATIDFDVAEVSIDGGRIVADFGVFIDTNAANGVKATVDNRMCAQRAGFGKTETTLAALKVSGFSQFIRYVPFGIYASLKGTMPLTLSTDAMQSMFGLNIDFKPIVTINDDCLFDGGVPTVSFDIDVRPLIYSAVDAAGNYATERANNFVDQLIDNMKSRLLEIISNALTSVPTNKRGAMEDYFSNTADLLSPIEDMFHFDVLINEVKSLAQLAGSIPSYNFLTFSQPQGHPLNKFVCDILKSSYPVNFGSVTCNNFFDPSDHVIPMAIAFGILKLPARFEGYDFDKITNFEDLFKFDSSILLPPENFEDLDANARASYENNRNMLMSTINDIESISVGPPTIKIPDISFKDIINKFFTGPMTMKGMIDYILGRIPNIGASGSFGPISGKFSLSLKNGLAKINVDIDAAFQSNSLQPIIDAAGSAITNVLKEVDINGLDLSGLSDVVIPKDMKFSAGGRVFASMELSVSFYDWIYDRNSPIQVSVAMTSFGASFKLSISDLTMTLDLGQDASVSLQSGYFEIAASAKSTGPISSLASVSSSIETVGDLEVIVPVVFTIDDDGFSQFVGSSNGFTLHITDLNIFDDENPVYMIDIKLNSQLLDNVYQGLNLTETVASFIDGNKELNTKIPIIDRSINNLFGPRPLSDLFRYRKDVNSYKSSCLPNSCSTSGLSRIFEKKVQDFFDSLLESAVPAGVPFVAKIVADWHNDLLILYFQMHSKYPLSFTPNLKTGLSQVKLPFVKPEIDTKLDALFYFDLELRVEISTTDDYDDDADIYIDQFKIGVELDASVDMSLSFGAISASVVGGSAKLSLGIETDILKTNPGDMIDDMKDWLSEYKSISSSLNTNLPISASIGDIPIGSVLQTTPTISITSSDLFKNKPSVTLNNMDKFMGLNGMSVVTLVGMFRSLVNALNDYKDDPVMTAEFPVIRRGLGDVLNLLSVLSELTDSCYEPPATDKLSDPSLKISGRELPSTYKLPSSITKFRVSLGLLQIDVPFVTPPSATPNQIVQAMNDGLDSLGYGNGLLKITAQTVSGKTTYGIEALGSLGVTFLSISFPQSDKAILGFAKDATYQIPSIPKFSNLPEFLDLLVTQAKSSLDLEDIDFKFAFDDSDPTFRTASVNLYYEYSYDLVETKSFKSSFDLPPISSVTGKGSAGFSTHVGVKGGFGFKFQPKSSPLSVTFTTYKNIHYNAFLEVYPAMICVFGLTYDKTTVPVSIDSYSGKNNLKNTLDDIMMSVPGYSLSISDDSFTISVKASSLVITPAFGCEPWGIVTKSLLAPLDIDPIFNDVRFDVITSVDVVNLTATAKFGKDGFGVGISGTSNMSLDASASFFLKDPYTDSTKNVKGSSLLKAIDEQVIRDAFGYSITLDVQGKMGDVDVDLPYFKDAANQLVDPHIDISLKSTCKQITLDASAAGIIKSTCWNVVVNGIPGLGSMKNMDFFTVVSLLIKATEVIAGEDGSGGMIGNAAMNTEIPLLGFKLSTAVSFVQKFLKAIESLNDPNNVKSSLRTLELKLESALGIRVSGTGCIGSCLIGFDMDFNENGKTLLVLTIQKKYAVDYEFSLLLDMKSMFADAGLTGGIWNVLDEIADVKGTLDIPMNGQASLYIKAGLDFTNPLSPVPILYGDSNVKLSFSVYALIDELTVSVGPATMILVNGKIAVDADGVYDPDEDQSLASNMVSVRFGLDPTKQYTTLSTSDFMLTVTGKAGFFIQIQDFEIYPIEITVPRLSDYLDPDSVQAASDGAVAAKIIIGADVQTLLTTIRSLITRPSPLEILLTNPKTFVDKVNNLLLVIEKMAKTVLNIIKVPMVGSLGSAVADSMIRPFREELVAMLSKIFTSVGLEDSIAIVIQKKLSTFFIDNSLLLDRVSPSNKIDYNDIELRVLNVRGEQLEYDGLIVPENADAVEWIMSIGQSFQPSFQVDFDLGIDGLPLSLETHSDIVTTIGWTVNLGFGFSVKDGFYIKTDEHIVDLDVSILLKNFNAKGKLFFLATDVVNRPAGALNTKVAGNVYLALVGGSSLVPGRLKPTEITKLGLSNSFTYGFTFTARADLDVLAYIDFDYMPSISFNLDARFTLTKTRTTKAVTTTSVVLKDIVLDLTELFQKFLKPYFTKVKAALSPAEPLFDLLDTRLPVISDFLGTSVTFANFPKQLEALNTKSLTVYIQGLEEAILQYQKIIDLIKLIETIVQSLEDTGTIPLGDYTVVRKRHLLEESPELFVHVGSASFFFDSRIHKTKIVPALEGTSININRGIQSYHTTQAYKKRGLQEDVASKMCDSIPDALAKQKCMSSFSGNMDKKKGGWEIPLVSSPFDAISLLLGKDIDLIRYRSPSMVLNVSWDLDFDPIPWPFDPPGYSVGTYGKVNAFFGIGLAYDTNGIRRAIEQEQWYLVFDGFYISNTFFMDVDKRPQFYASGYVTVYGRLNAGIISAGVKGTLNFDVSLQLADPDNDGKVRGSEIISLLSQSDGNPMSLFYLDVELGGSGSIYCELDFWFFSVTVIDIDIGGTILEYHNTPTLPSPTASGSSGSVTALKRSIQGDDKEIYVESRGLDGNTETIYISKGDPSQSSNEAPPSVDGSVSYNPDSDVTTKPQTKFSTIEKIEGVKSFAKTFSSGDGNILTLQNLISPSNVKGSSSGSGQILNLIYTKGPITIYIYENLITFDDDTPYGDVKYDNFQVINIQLSNYNDIVYVYGTSDITYNIYGNGGSDGYYVSQPTSSNSKSGLTRIDGNIYIKDTGASGKDTLTISSKSLSKSQFAQTGTLTDAYVTGLGMSGKVYYGSGTESLTVYMGTGSDSFSILSASSLVDVAVFGCEGGDTITVGNNGLVGGLDIKGTIGVYGGCATTAESNILDKFVFDDSANTKPTTGYSTYNSIKGFGLSDDLKLYYSGFRKLIMSLGEGGNKFTIKDTHSGDTQIDCNNGDDQVTIQGTTGRTTIYGNDGDDIFNIPSQSDPVTNTPVNLVNGVLYIDGQNGDDQFLYYLSGILNSYIHLDDTGNQISEINTIKLYGTPFDDNVLVRRNIIAFIHIDKTMENITYSTSFSTVYMNMYEGDDSVSFDDTSTRFIVDAGSDDDEFIIGQLFQNDRDSTSNVKTNGTASTTTFARGQVTYGCSNDLILYGGSGSDTFHVLRNRNNVYLKGGVGDDNFYSYSLPRLSSSSTKLEESHYIINAPVMIDGGDGVNWYKVIGSEVADNIVIQNDGIYGAGISTKYRKISNLTVDSAEGNDEIIVLSPTQFVQLYGGLGSDSVRVSPNLKSTYSVVARSYTGHYGFISHSLDTSLTSDTNYDGLNSIDWAVFEIFDDDDYGVIITKPSRIYDNILRQWDTYTYTIRLTKAPCSGCTIVVEPISAPFHLIDVSPRIVTFTSSNYDTLRTITLNPVDSSFTSQEVIISHNIKQVSGGDIDDPSSLIGDSIDDIYFSSYASIIVEPLPLKLSSSSEKLILVTESNGETVVVEGSTYTDYLWIEVFPCTSSAPPPGVDVSFSYDEDQLILSSDTISFDVCKYIVNVQGVADGVVEGIHYSQIKVSATTGYKIFPSNTVNVKIGDRDRGTVMILPYDNRILESDTAGDSLRSKSYKLVATKPITSGDQVVVKVNPWLTTAAKSGYTLSVDSTKSTLTSSSREDTVTVTATSDGIRNGATLIPIAPKSSILKEIQNSLYIDGGLDLGYDPEIDFKMLSLETDDPLSTTPFAYLVQAIEEFQIDNLTIYDTDNYKDLSVDISSSLVSGLDMIGSKDYDNRISVTDLSNCIKYKNIEEFNTRLGDASYDVDILSTSASTKLFLGYNSGSDTIKVKSISDPTYIFARADDDQIIVSSSDTQLDKIRAYLFVDSGSGEDTLTLDDSSNTEDGLNFTMGRHYIYGLEMKPSTTYPANFVQRIYLNATSGVFYLKSPSLTDVITLNYDDTDDDLRNAIQNAFFPAPEHLGTSTTGCGSSGKTPCAPCVDVVKSQNHFIVEWRGQYHTDYGFDIGAFSFKSTSSPRKSERLSPTENVDIMHRVDGVDYFRTEHLVVQFGSGDEVVNVRGTTAETKLYLNGGDEDIFLSSDANLGSSNSTSTRKLAGFLDYFEADISIIAGDGRHKLMISDQDSLLDASGNAVLSSSSLTGQALNDIYYSSSTTGNFADGIWIWLKPVDDTLSIVSTHKRTGYRTLTAVYANTGDDNITVDLTIDDGNLLVHGEEGDDTIDADTSTRSLFLFGGLGKDYINGSQSYDIIFGDTGLIVYTSDGDPANTVASYGSTDSDYTDGIHRGFTVAYTTDSVGDKDTIFGQSGFDMIFGGDNMDYIHGGPDEDVIFGDQGRLWSDDTITTSSFTSILFAETLSHGIGHNDTIITGSGDNHVVLAGVGADYIHGSSGTDVIIGDLGWYHRAGFPINSADYETTKFVLNPLANTDYLASYDMTNMMSIGSHLVATKPGMLACDYIDSQDGFDIIFGGPDDDTIVSSGSSLIFGDQGNTFYTEVPTSLSSIAFAETIERGVGGEDIIIALATEDHIVFGGSYDDVINTGDASDFIWGDFGYFHPDNGFNVILPSKSEFMTGGSILNSYVLGSYFVGTDASDAAHDKIQSGETGSGYDIVFGGPGDDEITSESHALIFGDQGHVFINGDDYRNVYFAETVERNVGGVDTINGVSDTHIIFGGLKGDTINTGDDEDIILSDWGYYHHNNYPLTLDSTKSQFPYLHGINAQNMFVVGSYYVSDVSDTAMDDVKTG